MILGEICSTKLTLKLVWCLITQVKFLQKRIIWFKAAIINIIFFIHYYLNGCVCMRGAAGSEDPRAALKGIPTLSSLFRMNGHSSNALGPDAGKEKLCWTQCTKATCPADTVICQCCVCSLFLLPPGGQKWSSSWRYHLKRQTPPI